MNIRVRDKVRYAEGSQYYKVISVAGNWCDIESYKTGTIYKDVAIGSLKIVKRIEVESKDQYRHNLNHLRISQLNHLNRKKEKIMEIPGFISKVFKRNALEEVESVARHFSSVHTGCHEMDILLMQKFKTSILSRSKVLDAKYSAAAKKTGCNEPCNPGDA